jgi:hypothetical protein
VKTRARITAEEAQLRFFMRPSHCLERMAKAHPPRLQGRRTRLKAALMVDS